MHLVWCIHQTTVVTELAKYISHIYKPCYDVFQIFASKEESGVEDFLSLIQFALQQVLGYGFIPIAHAWHICRVYKAKSKWCLKVQIRIAHLRMHMAIAVHNMIGHLYAESRAGVLLILPVPIQSLTVWSTTDRSLPFFLYHQPTSIDNSSSLWDGRSSSRKQKVDPIYSYLVFRLTIRKDPLYIGCTT